VVKLPKYVLPRFSFTPKTSIAFSKTDDLFLVKGETSKFMCFQGWIFPKRRVAKSAVDIPQRRTFFSTGSLRIGAHQHLNTSFVLMFESDILTWVGEWV